MDRANSTGFYDGLPRLSSFGQMTNPDNYTPLPDDWVIGVSDIVGSTKAIAAGRYKTVNMIGAAVISAQINTRNGRAFPFVFGGDGAGFACAPDQAEAAEATLAAVQCWASEEFDMQLRAAMVPVSTIRTAGMDVAVARYQAAPGVDYAMFGGGGLTWAETRMKAGRFSVAPAPAGTNPDLTGLSCRWAHMPAQNGTILSVVVQPTAATPGPEFAALADSIISIAQDLNRGGHPVPEQGPMTQWPPPGLALEAHASHGDMPLAKRKRQLLFQTLLNWFFLRTGIPVKGFDPGHYTRTVGRNADFRKFDDGLKMTLDCDQKTVDRLRNILEKAALNGIIRYGLHQQDEAMMTCIVPSINHDDHVHFIDGAAGGYTQAAAQIKAG